MDTTFSSSPYAQVCGRCGKELTDPASRERGIGPVCRRLDNALLASRIPADLVEARQLVPHALPLDQYHETARNAVELALGAILDEDEPKADWRDEIRHLEYALSWALPAQREPLLRIIEALGYVAVAAVHRGDAAKGKATVYSATTRTWDAYGTPKTEEGLFLFFEGPRNASARETIRSIPGRRFHAAQHQESGKAAWSVPASEAAAFQRFILSHYPNHQVVDAHAADLEGLVAYAQASAPAAPTPAPAAPSKPAVEVVWGEDGWLVVRSPFCRSYVDELKALIPYKDRRWSATAKAWKFAPRQRDRVKDLVERHYAAGDQVPVLWG